MAKTKVSFRFSNDVLSHIEAQKGDMTDTAFIEKAVLTFHPGNKPESNTNEIIRVESRPKGIKA